MSTDNETGATPEQVADVLSLVEPGEPIAREDQITDLQAALSTLKAEFTAYDKVVKQMQAACAEEDQAREALTRNLDQLMSLVSSTASKK
jgi:uncharacterized protein YlxW (UPF0749 family)